MSDCNICGSSSSAIEFGFRRGEHGGIGLSICEKCKEAVEWHHENTEDSRCVNCETKHSKSIELTQPGPEGNESWSAEISMCRECYGNSGGLETMSESSVSLRALANVNSTWDEQRQAAMGRDGYACQECRYSGGRLHVHHEVPRSNGGTDHVDNLETLCPDCHADRHDTEACRICGSIVHDDKGHANWSDDSGGSYEIFCSDCMEYIKKSGRGGSRCSICARFKDDDSKSSDIVFFADYPEDGEDWDVPAYPACDECRRNIIFSARQNTERYLDKKLPDEYVNVRHWEVKNE